MGEDEAVQSARGAGTESDSGAHLTIYRTWAEFVDHLVSEHDQDRESVDWTDDESVPGFIARRYERARHLHYVLHSAEAPSRG